MIEENKELHRRIRVLSEVAAKVEAQELFNETEPGIDRTRVVSKVFNDRDADALKKLAQAIIVNDRTIALLASRDQETARLVFARSADAEGDMNQLMRKACELLEGRGGGKPDLAQGGGKNLAKLDQAISAVLSDLKS
jgi:alanyl-tRNA synthetase